MLPVYGVPATPRYVAGVVEGLKMEDAGKEAAFLPHTPTSVASSTPSAVSSDSFSPANAPDYSVTVCARSWFPKRQSRITLFRVLNP